MSSGSNNRRDFTQHSHPGRLGCEANPNGGPGALGIEAVPCLPILHGRARRVPETTPAATSALLIT